ncbi:MAG: hypothetical protein M1819_006382 [Sarea resinae]|nr:MAG: hypothetical protein M1819_006382 [Sarea resinae]
MADSLDLPEKALSLLTRLGTLVRHTLTTNVEDPKAPSTDPQATGAGLVGDVASQTTRLYSDATLAIEFLKTEQHNGLVDDKTYFMEHIVQLAASLPSDSKIAPDLTNAFVSELWNSLQHPPLSFMGDDYKYRTADGSNNNRLYPQLGKAGSPYARSVEPVTQLPGALPEAGSIFDALFAREGSGREHPNKISSMLFYLATIIIHDLFRTSNHDPNRVENSSYLDLGPLYGHNEAQQASMRIFKDGLLKPDAFCEIRLLAMPPGVGTLLICFNRYHNYIVGQLAEINEGGRFSLPAGITPSNGKAYDAAVLKRDNDLFQTGRLITCGLFVNILLIDYVRTILNLNRTKSEWVLDPRENDDSILDMTTVAKGIGNQVSVEFNLIYRWHAAISTRDDEWTQGMYKQVFPGKDVRNLTLPEFTEGLRAWQMSQPSDPGQRTFGGLTRQENGSFPDSDLVNILTGGTEDIAGAFGARNVPTILRLVEVLGIEQARKWQVATLNEVRKYFQLEPYKKFSDISSDPDVAQSLETLYEHPDFVEFYPGLIAEDAKDVKLPGSGICLNFTTSRAILSDAVTLVRGDRFFTTDYSPANLTSWGYNQIQSDPQIAGGGVLYKLLMRAFPDYYSGNSAYAMFPFTVPDENRKILRSLGTEKDYDFSRPSLKPQPKVIETWAGAVSILEDQASFKVPWGPHTHYLTGHDYMLSGDSPTNAEQKKFVSNAVYCPHDGLNEIRQYYEKLTTDLVLDKSHKLRHSYQLDVVADVANIAHANFIAKLFYIPLKTKESPVGAYTEEELNLILSVLFAYVFLDQDVANDFNLRLTAKQGTTNLSKIVQLAVEAVRSEDFVGLRAINTMMKGADGSELLKDYGANLIKRLSDGGKSVDEVVWTIIPTAAAAVATQAQGTSQMLDLYLSDKYKHHWKDIESLAQSDTPESFEKLRKYALEAYRLDTPAFGTLRWADVESKTIKDGTNTVIVNRGDEVYVNFVTAGVDPEKFPDPEEIKLDRPEDSYIHHGYGPHACLGRPIVVTAMAAQLRIFGRLKNLRRAPGGQGQLKYTTIPPDIKVYMKEDWSDWWPFPTTMKVLYDE